jgi:hypothetical protein
MEPLGCERHGWADPRGRDFREEGESTCATWTGSPKGVFEGRKHHKPPSTLKISPHMDPKLTIECWVGSSIWLGSTRTTEAAGASVEYSGSGLLLV